MEISLIQNTGIQFFELPEDLLIDLNNNVIKAQRFYEFKFGDKIYLDPCYYFPDQDKFLRREDLKYAGCFTDVNANIIDESAINSAQMNWLDVDQLLTINRIDAPVGDKRLSALEQIENKWLPMPYFTRDPYGMTSTPTGWCRIKLRLNEDKSTKNIKAYKLIMAFDTNAHPQLSKESPKFQGEPFMDFAMCGVSSKDLEMMDEHTKKHIHTNLIPLKAYEFCNPKDQPWLNRYLQEILNSSNPDAFEVGNKMKYLVYYCYLITYLYALHKLPDVRLYNDAGQPPISVNMVLDVGNSRTFGLVAEDPIDSSFSKAAILKLRDLETGELYADPFDMRLCFKEEVFGFDSSNGTFKWPSIVRLGKEALRNIYAGEGDFEYNNQFDTSHSSPKRFLWDTAPYHSQWKYISERERVIGPSRTVDYEGIMQQFYSDGRFAANPQTMGDKSAYSRSSLMTFCFMEILLQVRQQINSYEFRRNNGEDHRKREIKRVILTCPTAMTREEQKTLRRCMEEASIVLRRYYSDTYHEQYNPANDYEKIEIIPSIRDLSLTADNLSVRRSWSYDEATCCQMVYLFSELKRYLGNAEEFFSSYGRRRNGEEVPSLTIATLDIGAGTTDIMICNYKHGAESIKANPLFWESFKIAGDDLVKRIIIDVLLDSPIPEYPEASGVITSRLKSMGISDVAEKMHHFFDDTQSMGVKEKRMRKEFMIQVLHPIATRLLDRLQKNEDESVMVYDDFFKQNRPAASLMDFFATQMGFRFEDLTIRYSPKFLNEIIRRVFESSMRKWAALFHAFKCDIVLLSGRPCSLKQVHYLQRRLFPVAPNRLISMNTYRVGSWYPGSTDIGHFKDNKSMVAVGALIAYLAENGRLNQFKLNVDLLKTKVLPTSEYIGVMNPQTGSLNNILTPDFNGANMEIAAFPVMLGSRQLDVEGYPANLLYVLRFNEKNIRARAIETVRKKLGLPDNTQESEINPSMIEAEIEAIKFRLRIHTPLKFRLERDYYNDKEGVKIESVEDNDRNDLSRAMFEMALQTWSEDDTNWLDTGIFKLHIGN